jgi:flagella basal body P-ring formation protein FlgA
VALVGILTFAVGALTFAAENPPASPWQPPDTIAEAARAAATATGSGKVEAVAIDARLKLARCGAALDTEIQRPIQRGHGTVAVSCSGPNPWRLFVPVRVTNEVPVLVLARNVQPGEVLTAAELAIERRASASLPFDYLSDVTQALGFALRRSQQAGAVLGGGALERPEIVARGALVTLLSGNGPVTVKSAGVALEPARLNERVRVRTASGRVIEGTAAGPGQVRVGS